MTYLAENDHVIPTSTARIAAGLEEWMRIENQLKLIIVGLALAGTLLVSGTASAQELPPDQNFNAELWEFTDPSGPARNVYKCTLCTFQQALDTPLPGANWDKNISEGNRRLIFPTSTNIAPDVGPEIDISLDLVPEIEGDDHFLIAQVLSTVSVLGFGQQGVMAIGMVRRDTTHTFSAGQAIHKVTNGEGTDYIMWSMEEQHVAAFNPFVVNGLAGMSVPNGWSYSSELLSEDFIVTTPGGVATVYSSPGWWNFQEIVPVPEPGTWVDTDGDGVGDNADAFSNDSSETIDTDNDGVGNNADTDDDGDGVFDDTDAFPLDPSEQSDSDGDGIGDNSDVFPDNAIVRGNQFLQTTSASANVTSLHVLNTSDREQSFRALMYDGNGDRVGGTPLIGDPVPSMGRIVLTSEDIEGLFNTAPWKGPAMLEVRGESTFDVMSKLISPSGLVSNTNCVREDRVLNIEGFDSNNMSYVRLINTSGSDTGEITGTLYDFEGNAVGNANTVLASNLAPYQQAWVNRDNLAEQMGAEWNGEALLEVNKVTGLKLLNLNYITDEQTFFNFSCFEDSTSGRVYLQTTSTSQNVSATHLVNTSDVAQQLTGTLYGSDGSQVGLANQPLHSGTIPSKGRIIISSEDIETAFNISPWSGPAMLEVSGTESFELMTKLTSPSGLISNTNCVRQDQVHNIGGFDQTDMTYLRFFNIGDTPITNIRGSLYDDAGNVVGETNPVLIDELPAKAHVWRNRNQLSDLIGDTWNGTASLKIDNADSNLRLLNLNFINNETFFNFSCYETGQ